MAKRDRRLDLDELLVDIIVHPPGMWENDDGPKDWYAVSTANDSIIAYFANESHACNFRLALIAARICPL